MVLALSSKVHNQKLVGWLVKKLHNLAETSWGLKLSYRVVTRERNAIPETGIESCC